MPAHRSHGGTLPTVLAIPPVPVVKDHVHARDVLRQVIHSEELHYGRALPTRALRIEPTYAHQLARIVPRIIPRIIFPNSPPNHGWKPVEVTHPNLLPWHK
jgi:hypothetical protein